MENISITKEPNNIESHSCRCGEEGSSTYPELDASLIPHEIRHPAIIGALESFKPGQGIILVAPHKPIPLLAQIEKKHPAIFSVTFLDEGPDKWHVQFIRS